MARSRGGSSAWHRWHRWRLDAAPVAGAGALVLAIGMLAGCGPAQPSASPPASSAPASSAPASSAPAPSAPVTIHLLATAAKLPTQRSAAPAGPSLAWSLIEVDPASGRIYLSAAQRDCVVPQTVSVVESGASITISVLGSRPPPPGRPCTAQGQALLGYVLTSQPIAGRTIVHGPER
jgi:hypothetical protein